MRPSPGRLVISSAAGCRPKCSPTTCPRVSICSFRAAMRATSAVTIAANAACTGRGWRNSSARSSPRTVSARDYGSRRLALVKAATSVRRVNAAARSGSGALASSSSASGASSSGNACSAMG